MANPLYNVPGLAGYIAATEGNRAQDMQQLQQASGVLNIQQAMQKAARERQFGEGLAALGPEPSQEALTQLATKFATPQQVLQIHQRSLDRRDAQANRPDSRPEILRLIDATKDLPPDDARLAPVNARIKLLSERPDPRERSSSLGLLIGERNALPEGHPDRAVYDQAITKFQPGGVTVNLPPNAPLIPGKPAQNKVDEGLLDSGMRQQQLSSIERQFKPEYQQIGSRVDALRLSVKDKVGLSDLDPGEKKFLTEFSQYKRNSIDALNQYIKSVTGAAMTNAEAERILRGLPNPGTGLFDGDSPTEFKAKLDDAMRQTRMAEARLVYIKRNGLTLADVELDRMPSVMNQKGGELEAAIRKQQPNMPMADVRKMVRRNLAQEFGLLE